MAGWVCSVVQFCQFLGIIEWRGAGAAPGSEAVARPGQFPVKPYWAQFLELRLAVHWPGPDTRPAWPGQIETRIITRNWHRREGVQRYFEHLRLFTMKCWRPRNPVNGRIVRGQTRPRPGQASPRTLTSSLAASCSLQLTQCRHPQRNILSCSPAAPSCGKVSRLPGKGEIRRYSNQGTQFSSRDCQW